MDWKTDRNRLREIIRSKNRAHGNYATFLYVLVSHMRGKIHMACYRKHNGGWRGWAEPPKSSAFETLQDQEEWIRKFNPPYERIDKELFELAERVLCPYNDGVSPHGQEAKASGVMSL